jgi:AcrR family transcriptional regulator
MARLSRAESRAQTRERLLTAAAELFTERGVNGTSVEQIAERAGYSRGAFYGNFADKHDLVRALLLERTRTEEREVREMGASFEGAAGRLREWNRERARHLPQWLALRLELVLHALRDPESRPLVAERDRFARGAIAEGVRANAPGADAGFLALIIHALEDGLLIQHLLAPDEVPADIVVDAVSWLLSLSASQRPPR